MPSDSVVSFLDLARESRLLPTDQVQELVRRSEVPQENLPALCEALESRGLLTAFQSKRIREGRGRELAFAGYPILDDLGPCPGGFALKAKHPSLRTPIVLRRLSTDWLAPADNLSAYVQRAQQVSTVVHPHLATLLEAGAYEDQLFVVLEPYEGANLDELVRDIGPMPAFLACAFIRQAALGLDAAHKAGHSHGDVRPGVLYLHPLVESSRKRPDGSPMFRPGPNAAVKVAELGLVPRRPALNEWPGATLDDWNYLPPERIANDTATPAGDVYGLGQTLAYLLTARPPFPAKSPDDLLAMLASSDPLPLAVLRPDLPPDLVTLVRYLTAKDPTQRPTLSTAIERLAAFLSPGALVQPVAAGTKPAESSIMGTEPPVEMKAVPVLANVPLPAELVAKPIDLAPGEWTVQPFEGSTGDGEHFYAPAAAVQPISNDGPLHDFSAPTTPVKHRRRMTAEQAKKERKKWIFYGVVLWFVIIPILYVIAYFTYFGGSKDPESGRPAKQRR